MPILVSWGSNLCPNVAVLQDHTSTKPRDKKYVAYVPHYVSKNEQLYQSVDEANFNTFNVHHFRRIIFKEGSYSTFN